MNALVRLHGTVFGMLERLLDDWFLPTLARFLFAAVLLVYFWNSALTKISDGLFGFLAPSVGAYAQILPKRMEAVTYDPSQLGFVEHVIVYAGTYAEFILPALIVLGLFTRLASLGMIGFLAVMTVVDINGHGADATAIGAWFDRDASAIIADQRSLWTFILIVLVVKGPGPFSLDRLLGRVFRRPAF